MPDLLEQGAAWLDEQRHNHLTRTVTYVRGDDSVDVQATIGQTNFRFDDRFSGASGGGATIRHVARDYLIRTGDLVINDQVIEPRRGDRIREVIGGQALEHEVMSPNASGGEPEWRWSDPFGKTMRIHTKKVSPNP